MNRKTTAKFQNGDTVFLTRRAPVFLGAKKRRRKIVRSYYDPKRECRYYILGTNNKSEKVSYPFRSYMLKKTRLGHRPKKGS